MGTFTDAEAQYLTSQRIGRLATVGADGRPRVKPVGIFFDPETETVVIGGSSDMAATQKFRDAQRRPDVAVVVDDVASTDPWTVRGIEIRGRAEAHTDGGEEVGTRLGAGFRFNPAWIRIRPQRIVAWGIETDAVSPSKRDVP
jgi:pyridoxamine 5'-phosphate oxidase family protein